MRERSIWIFMGVVVVALASLIGLGTSGLMVLVIAPLMVLGMAGVGRLLARPVDVQWLPTVVVFGFIAKLIGSAVRHYFVHVVYASGDAYGYFRVGLEFARQWRAGNPPGLSGNRGEGTQALEAIAGVIFTPFMPDFLGGFLLFGALSFIGQLGLYAAFRRWAEPHQLKPFALLIFFLPSYVFWPSSIGKDAIMLLGLGIASYCMARCLAAYETRWLVGTALALAGIGFVRIHISALFVGALLVTSVIAKPRAKVPGMTLRRMVVIFMIGAVGLVFANAFQARFGADLSSFQDVEEFSGAVVDRTSRGSLVPGGPVAGPADVPGAVLLVLYRPFLWEGGGTEVRMSSIETTVLLGLTLWKVPAMYRNRKKWRSNSLVVFSTVYVLAFCIAFSVIRNLGIIARQRTQVLAFLLIIIVSLGWEKRTERIKRPTGQRSTAGSERQLVTVGSRTADR